MKKHNRIKKILDAGLQEIPYNFKAYDVVTGIKINQCIGALCAKLDAIIEYLINKEEE